MLHQIPNVITVVRVLLIIPLVYLLWQENYFYAVGIFVIAGLSDGIDGFLAKHFHWESRFGAILDPLADKALLVSTILLLCLKAQLSWWLFAVVTLRDLLIVIGAVLYHRALGPYKMSPSRLSKANTFLQILLVFSVLVSLGIYPLYDWYLHTLVVLVYISTVSSGIHYIALWGGRYQRNKQLNR